jgi:bacterioferritin (cytochrome b1)
MKEKIIELLNNVLGHELKHFNFYLHAAIMIQGMERVLYRPLFEKEMQSELEHVRLFGDKIVALGGVPNFKHDSLFVNTSCGKTLLEMAIQMEKEVLRLYHDVYDYAEKYDKVYSDMSIKLLLEENIEHTTADVEEMLKILPLSDR